MDIHHHLLLTEVGLTQTDSVALIELTPRIRSCTARRRSVFKVLTPPRRSLAEGFWPLLSKINRFHLTARHNLLPELAPLA
jgi:hypothetical protein